MSYDEEREQAPAIDQISLPLVSLPSIQGSIPLAPSMAADRLYQLAAVTAGFFLLVTLL